MSDNRIMTPPPPPPPSVSRSIPGLRPCFCSHVLTVNVSLCSLETLLNDSECPQDVKGIVAEGGKHCMFAYKRIDAKIAWPTTSS
ncbi:hypothetical protein PR048_007656, partial [Dryococelus australis]